MPRLARPTLLPRALGAATAALALLASAGPAAGQTDDLHANQIGLHANDAPVDDAEVAARLARIEGALDAGERYAGLWWNGWLGVFTVSALASGTLSVGASGTDVPVWRISALRSALGVASVLAVPCPAWEEPSLLRTLPASTPAERLAKLRAAQAALRRAAKMERLNRAWFSHAGSIAVSAAFSLWLWRGYHRPGAALASLATGLAATESKIFTSPTRAIDDEAALLDGPLPAGSLLPRPADAPPAARWSIAPAPNGVALVGNF